MLKKRVHWSSIFEDREDSDVLNKRESCLRERNRQHEWRNEVNEGVSIHSKVFGGIESKSICLIKRKVIRKIKIDRCVEATL